jgi:thiol-disulfide isomerase/thioredoxin
MENQPPVKKEWLLPVSIVIAALLIGGAIIWSTGKKAELAANPGEATDAELAKLAEKVLPVTDADHIWGDRNAPVKIVTFTDLECPYCQQFHGTIRQALAEYDGRVAFIYRNHTYLTEDLVTDHAAEISDLDPAVEYAISVTGMDQHAIQATPFEQNITTRTDSRPPQILSNKSMGRVSGRGASAQANVYIKIETDELSRIHVAYAKGIVTKSFEQSTSDDSFNTYHLITIPAEAGDVYSYQVEAYDEAGNKTTADAATVPVEQSKANATEVITRTFLNNFGWISKLSGN